ncbi:MAG: hypothetical protein F6K22_07270 [Okeania sp. SIO2F4]|uniref:hypothetical protein n=1 Tax=Okeania sp. SIO2F4 TaxID=2607790 RepID=UPI00142A6D78|nr:hypothetical protein [Okeania sp. SIO2F4]NES02661.1 hypothetical protein [Okeania sp. SIO2F4]
MSRNIRLFPSYSQRENQTTNHCLLILKMLYEENPKFLSEVLSKLLGESLSGKIEVKFTQQGNHSAISIQHSAFGIFVKNKATNKIRNEDLLTSRFF